MGPAASTATATTRAKATMERLIDFATTTSRTLPGRRREPPAQLEVSPGGTFEFGAKPCYLCKMVSKPHALRCGKWGRGCPGKVSDFGPELTDNATPGSPAFVLDQQVAALSRESKKLQADRVRAERASRADQGGQAGWAGAPYAATAASRRVALGATEYEPDRPPA